MMNYDEAYEIIEQYNYPEPKELDEALIIAMIELVKIYIRYDLMEAKALASQISSQGEALNNLITTIGKHDHTLSIKDLALFLRGYQIYNFYMDNRLSGRYK